MGKAGKLVVALVAVALVVVAAVWVANGKDNKNDPSNGSSQGVTPSDSNGEKQQTTNETAPAPQAGQAPAITIVFNGSGFAPASGSMKAGGTVKVVNQSNQTLDFDSDPHPVHTDNRELNLGGIAPGESRTFTITKKGNWGFHNHLNASQNGTIMVE